MKNDLHQFDRQLDDHILHRVKIKVGALMQILEIENIDPYLQTSQPMERGRTIDRVPDLNVLAQDEVTRWTTSFLPIFDAPTIQPQEDTAMNE